MLAKGVLGSHWLLLLENGQESEVLPLSNLSVVKKGPKIYAPGLWFSYT